MKSYLLLVFIALSNFCIATIITVKKDGTGNFETIQEAIDYSVDGDTVLVYPGTYFENIQLYPKGITLASLYLITQDELYIHSTIIDGNQNGSCVRIIQGTNEEMVLCGFTIRNGSGFVYNMGGGIYIDSADPIIKNCRVVNNSCWYGGGIYLTNTTSTFLSGNLIAYNYASFGGGGVLLGESSDLIFDSINRNNIYLNHANIGCDIIKGIYSPAINVYVDTFTVINPDFHFAASNDIMGFPVNDIYFDIKNAKIEPVNADIYVSPDGDDNNSGLTPDDPLKTIWYAYKKIYPDSINPKTINLLSGVYSNSSNGELFPINARSYVSLIGDDSENTILDAEFASYHLNSSNLTRNFSIINLSFINGSDPQIFKTFGSVSLNYNSNILFENIFFNNCTGIVISSLHSDSIHLHNLYLSNNYGAGIRIGNGFLPKKYFYMENCIVEKTFPGFYTPLLEGGSGISIGSSLYGCYFEGKIINTQINNCRYMFDPIWGNGFSSALTVGNKATVDLVNATIGNNVVVDDYAGAAVGVNEGAVLNIYNSIIYRDSLFELTLGNSTGSSYTATANICYSDLEGGEQAVQNWYNQHIVNWLDGNIDSDPGWDTTAAIPYALPWNSPCVDAGVPMYEPGMDFPYIKIENGIIVLYKIDGDTLHIPSTDLAGNPRIINGRIDMGAYEFQDTGTMIKEAFLKKLRESKIDVFPNPFSTHTFINFEMQSKAWVTVNIFNVNGNLVKKLIDTELPEGKFSLTWEGNDDWSENVHSGTYYAELLINGEKAGSAKIIKK